MQPRRSRCTRSRAITWHAPDGILTPYLKVAKTNERNMIKAGVRMLVSTDAGIENPVLIAESRTAAADTVDPRVKLGEGHFNAMVALEELGMDRMEILKSATSNIAKAYKLDAKIGTLEPGKIAEDVAPGPEGFDCRSVLPTAAGPITVRLENSALGDSTGRPSRHRPAR